MGQGKATASTRKPSKAQRAKRLKTEQDYWTDVARWAWSTVLTLEEIARAEGDDALEKYRDSVQTALAEMTASYVDRPAMLSALGDIAVDLYLHACREAGETLVRRHIARS